MIRLELLLKVFYKPGEVFEELKGKIEWKDGLIVYAVVTMLAIIIGSVIIRGTGFEALPITCGFGPRLSLFSGAFYITLNIAGIALVTWLLSIITPRLGGKGGGSSELFGMFCYTRVLFVFRAFASMFLAAFAYYKVMFAIAKATRGIVIAPSFVGIKYAGLGTIFLFFLWELWLMGSALSKSQGVSLKRSVVIIFGLNLLLSIISYGVQIILA